MSHYFKRATRHLLFCTLLAVALSLTAVRLAAYGAGHFQQPIADAVSQALGVQVTIGQLSGTMHGVRPEWLFKDIALAGGGSPVCGSCVFAWICLRY